MSEYRTEGDPEAGDDSVAGRLLVATPALGEGPFRRSVVLMLDHDEDGALGVILNHPLEIDVDEILPGWSDLLAPPAGLFQGGPVAMDAALGVGMLVDDDTDRPDGWRPVFGRVGLVDLETPVHQLGGSIDGLRIFAGYAGWGAGQLEAEVAEGSWLVLDSSPGDLVTARPDALWHEVLRRQDDDLRLLSTFPDDPSWN